MGPKNVWSKINCVRKCFWSKKFQGSEKIFGQNKLCLKKTNFRTKIILGSREISDTKTFLVKKFCNKENFGSKKMLVKKNFRSKNNLIFTTNVYPKRFQVQKKILVQKYLGPKIFGSKKLGSENKLSKNKIWFRRTMDPKKFLVQQNVRSKKSVKGGGTQNCGGLVAWTI